MSKSIHCCWHCGRCYIINRRLLQMFPSLLVTSLLCSCIDCVHKFQKVSAVNFFSLSNSLFKRSFMLTKCDQLFFMNDNKQEQVLHTHQNLEDRQLILHNDGDSIIKEEIRRSLSGSQLTKTGWSNYKNDFDGRLDVTSMIGGQYAAFCGFSSKIPFQILCPRK